MAAVTSVWPNPSITAQSQDDSLVYLQIQWDGGEQIFSFPASFTIDKTKRAAMAMIGTFMNAPPSEYRFELCGDKVDVEFRQVRTLLPRNDTLDIGTASAPLCLYIRHGSRFSSSSSVIAGRAPISRSSATSTPAGSAIGGPAGLSLSGSQITILQKTQSLRHTEKRPPPVITPFERSLSNTLLHRPLKREEVELTKSLASISTPRTPHPPTQANCDASMSAAIADSASPTSKPHKEHHAHHSPTITDSPSKKGKRDKTLKRHHKEPESPSAGNAGVVDPSEKDFMSLEQKRIYLEKKRKKKELKLARLRKEMMENNNSSETIAYSSSTENGNDTSTKENKDTDNEKEKEKKTKGALNGRATWAGHKDKPQLPPKPPARSDEKQPSPTSSLSDSAPTIATKSDAAAQVAIENEKQRRQKTIDDLVGQLLAGPTSPRTSVDGPLSPTNGIPTTSEKRSSKEQLIVNVTDTTVITSPTTTLAITSSPTQTKLSPTDKAPATSPAQHSVLSPRSPRAQPANRSSGGRVTPRSALKANSSPALPLPPPPHTPMHLPPLPHTVMPRLVLPNTSTTTTQATTKGQKQPARPNEDDEGVSETSTDKGLRKSKKEKRRRDKSPTRGSTADDSSVKYVASKETGGDTEEVSAGTTEEVIRLRKKLKALKKEVKQLKAQQQEDHTIIFKLKEDMTEHKKLVESKNDRIRELKEEARERDMKILTLKSKNTNLEAREALRNAREVRHEAGGITKKEKKEKVKESDPDTQPIESPMPLWVINEHESDDGSDSGAHMTIVYSDEQSRSKRNNKEKKKEKKHKKDKKGGKDKGKHYLQTHGSPPSLAGSLQGTTRKSTGSLDIPGMDHKRNTLGNSLKEGTASSPPSLVSTPEKKGMFSIFKMENGNHEEDSKSGTIKPERSSGRLAGLTKKGRRRTITLASSERGPQSPHDAAILAALREGNELPASAQIPAQPHGSPQLHSHPMISGAGTVIGLHGPGSASSKKGGSERERSHTTSMPTLSLSGSPGDGRTKSAQERRTLMLQLKELHKN